MNSWFNTWGAVKILLKIPQQIYFLTIFSLLLCCQFWKTNMIKTNPDFESSGVGSYVIRIFSCYLIKYHLDTSIKWNFSLWFFHSYLHYCLWKLQHYDGIAQMIWNLHIVQSCISPSVCDKHSTCGQYALFKIQCVIQAFYEVWMGSHNRHVWRWSFISWNCSPYEV